MPNKTENIKRKKIRDEIKKQEHDDFENNLPIEKEKLKELFDYLDNIFPENGCDNTNKLTRNFLEKAGKQNIDVVLEWLANNGGYCDCEILANVEEKFEYLTKPKQKIQLKAGKTIQREKLDTLATDFGFSIKQVPAPWLLIATSQGNRATYQFQIGKKSYYPVKLESDFPVEELSKDKFLQDYWITRTELNRELEFVIDRHSIHSFEVIQIKTKRWMPVFIFAYKQGMKWCLVFQTELSRIKNDIKELEKLLAEI
jgi:hypothetical protein